MRNVMVRCIFSVLIVALSHVLPILTQERPIIPWSDQQVLADDWQPFVPPSFTQDRYYQNYPRTETVRQFFGKNVNTVHNSLKKSFQASPANNVDQFAVPPILGTFNSFGLQTIQTRHPLLEKNIKDGQFLDQPSHYPTKYHHQSVQSQQQQQQPAHRFPAYSQSAPQYQPVNQYQHYQNINQYSNRFENPSKPQTQLLQAPSRTVSTSVQVFPPPHQNHYPSNGYFLGVPPPKSENYVDEDTSGKKQTRPNDFLVANNVATIYGSKDPTLNIPPPVAKPTPFVRPEIQNHFLYENVKPPPERYELANNFYKMTYNEPPTIKHIEHKKVEETNPSKQVYEQLSHFGRPFSLPKESATEYTRLKPESGESEGLLHSYSLPTGHYKKDKVKQNQQYSHVKNVGRIPVNSVYSDINGPSSQSNLLVDYEPGRLQSIKTVTYIPQREIIRFNEEDVSSNIDQYQTSEKFNDLAVTPFLPTPTEMITEHEPHFIHYEKFTTPHYEATSRLPQNHKYSNSHGTRNRYQQSTGHESTKYYAPSTETAPEPQYVDDRRHPSTTPAVGYENEEKYPYYETTTRKNTNRRRKPSKNKTKDYSRPKVNAYTDTTHSANDVFVSDASTTEASVQTYTTRKKTQNKFTTTTEAQTDENYPNYPNYPNFANFGEAVKQYNYPKEYQYEQSSTQTPTQYESEDAGYFSSQKEEEKENYPPPFSTTTTTSTAATTRSPETSTVSLKPRVKPKFNTTRPRFSIKDYKRTTAASSISTASTTTEGTSEGELEKKNNRKNLFASRLRNRTESSTEENETASEATRKYKPRPRPSKYKTTSTTPTPEVTSERVNTFKPSTSNRYRSTTSKYFNRYRTTTEITSNDADDVATSSSDKKPVRTMLYSAKRSSILRPKSTTTPKVEYEDEEDVEDELENEAEEQASAATPKKTFGRYKTTPKLEKADDVSETSIMTSSEEEEEKDKLKSAGEKANESLAANEGDGEDDEVLVDIKENLETTTSEATPGSSTTTPVAEERNDEINDDNEKVSKVSSLTSTSESKLPVSFFRKWPSNDNQNQ